MQREYRSLNSTIMFSLLAILTALITVLTMIVQIPVPATQGYINLGDAGVLFTGLFLGPLGGIAGGVGSALADFFTGYYLYVPITLVVKGMEGSVTGLVFHKMRVVKHNLVRLVIALVLGSLVMISGYLIAESYLYGFLAALTEVPGNLFQVISGSVLGSIAYFAVNRAFMIQPTDTEPTKSE